MFQEVKTFFKGHYSSLILGLTVFLLILLAFALGYLAGEKNSMLLQVLE